MHTFDQENPAADPTRKHTDAMVHRMMLSLLLARSTLDQGEDQHDGIRMMMENFRTVLLNQTVQTMKTMGGDDATRNLMTSNITEEIADIMDLAQKMAKGMRGEYS